MNMSITGGSKSQKELITNVSHWVANKVLGPRLSRVVDIDYIITMLNNHGKLRHINYKKHLLKCL